AYEDKRVLDYGYGGAGHLRALAMCGGECTGVDVDPILKVLYSKPEDQGKIGALSRSGRPGKLWLVDGVGPGEGRGGGGGGGAGARGGGGALRPDPVQEHAQEWVRAPGRRCGQASDADAGCER